MTQDEALHRLIEIAHELDDILETLEFYDSKWETTYNRMIVALTDGYKYAAHRAKKILQSREADKLLLFNGRPLE